MCFFHVFRWQPRRGPTTYAHRAVMIYLDYTSFNRNGISPRLILFRSIHNEYQDHQFHWTMDHGSVLVNKQRALAGKYTRIKLMMIHAIFLRRKQVGIWYNSWFTFSGKVSKKKTLQDFMGSPPPFARNYHPITPSFPPQRTEPPQTSLRYLGASKADDKCFFPSSLHGCSVWWPETQRRWVGPRKSTRKSTQGFVLRIVKNFSPNKTVRSVFLVDSPEHKTSNHFGGFRQVSEDDFGGGWRSDAHLGCKVWTSGYVFFCFVLAATTQPTKKNQKET